jgi:UDP-glucose 4-epimerase
MKTILVTGGAGYIGSHTVLSLLESGFKVIIVDNLSNSKYEPVNRIEKITSESLQFYHVDLVNLKAIQKIFSLHQIDAVIHFAGLKAVGESTEEPLSYYNNNISGTINLLVAMQTARCKNLIFSSSATIYGDPRTVPIRENFPTSATNPYGRTKLIIENMLEDLYQSDQSWNIISLRYFNPVGAHSSGLIGEDPNGIPNNLFPYISQVAVGKRANLQVFGDDYPTSDGTGVRDYIHVVDLADGHIKALDKAFSDSGLVAYNLGTGQGYSVLQIANCFALESGVDIPIKIVSRRKGDIAECWSDSSKARNELGWYPKKNLQDMLRDAWNWQRKNPNGYC